MQPTDIVCFIEKSANRYVRDHLFLLFLLHLLICFDLREFRNIKFHKLPFCLFLLRLFYSLFKKILWRGEETTVGEIEFFNREKELESCCKLYNMIQFLFYFIFQVGSSLLSCSYHTYQIQCLLLVQCLGITLGPGDFK